MYHQNVWAVVFFNILVVFSLSPPPAKNCSLEFNNGMNEMMVKWIMKSNDHNVKCFNISLIIKSWNESGLKDNCTCFPSNIDYEYNITIKYLPATMYQATVTSCNDECRNCKLYPDPCTFVVNPDKPEINVSIDSCEYEVCSFRAIIANALADSSLYVLEEEKALKLNFSTSEDLPLLNESSILAVNISNITYFKINISERCGDTFSLVAVNTFRSFITYSDIKPLHLPLCNTSFKILIILFILVIIIVILVGLLVYFKCRKTWNEPENIVEILPLRRMNSLSNRYSLRFFKRVNALSRELDADTLQEFLTAHTNVKEILQDEFKEIPTKLSNLFGSQYATKNRYLNILPYENNRVKIFSNPSYDYINASYIKGYLDKQNYIATQGPLKNSLDDFWGMIWDNNIDKIVMLTNFKEHGQVKCDEYWLENQTKHLLNIMVVHKTTETHMNFKIREFKIVKGNNSKEITHYHFTTWSDDTIPHELDSLIKFIKIIRESNSGKDVPIVVHCSAGIGRTGVFILCDYILDMYKYKGYIDVPYALHCLRNFRLNMVKNELQYIFTYCLVNEYLKQKTTEIKLETLFEMWQIFTQEINLTNDVETTASRDYLLDMVYTKAIHFGWENNKHKHRADMPPKNCKGYISLQRYPLHDEESYYTPAVKIPNQTNTKTYISTIQPLLNTFVDFWRLVDETKASIILSLQNFDDSSTAAFWPTSTHHDLNPCDYLRLSFTKMKKYKGFLIVELNIYNTLKETEEVRPVYVLHLYEWKPNSLPSVDIFIKYYKHYVQRSDVSTENTTLIACSDGIQGCGLVLTFLFVIEKISNEKLFDVCGRVNRLRYYLDSIMTKPSEYKFIYECVKELYGTGKTT